MRQGVSVIVATAFLLGTGTAALSDRAPNPEERARIETTISAAGYTSWEEIELDDGHWEVDDARKAEDSEDCDLKISTGSYEIIETDC